MQMESLILPNPRPDSKRVFRGKGKIDKRKLKTKHIFRAPIFFGLVSFSKKPDLKQNYKHRPSTLLLSVFLSYDGTVSVISSSSVRTRCKLWNKQGAIFEYLFSGQVQGQEQVESSKVILSILLRWTLKSYDATHVLWAILFILLR